MKIARYLHNGFAHVGVVNDRGRLLNLPTRLSVLEVLALPIHERNLIEAQAGRLFNHLGQLVFSCARGTVQ